MLLWKVEKIWKRCIIFSVTIPTRQILPPLAFLSFWNKKKGIEFAVVIDKNFKDINSAEEAVGKLPPEIAAKTKILSQWDADTVFFNRRALQN